MFIYTIFIHFLSLRGLPTFLGFLQKLTVIQHLTFCGQYVQLFILVISALEPLIFYLCICYSAFILNYFGNI